MPSSHDAETRRNVRAIVNLWPQTRGGRSIPLSRRLRLFFGSRVCLYGSRGYGSIREQERPWRRMHGDDSRSVQESHPEEPKGCKRESGSKKCSRDNYLLLSISTATSPPTSTSLPAATCWSTREAIQIQRHHVDVPADLSTGATTASYPS
jgi:hypothetical protein